MNRRAGVAVLASVLVLGLSSARGVVALAAEDAIAKDDSGLDLSTTVTTIEGVNAVAGASLGAVGGAAILDQALIGNVVEERNVTRRVLMQDSFQENHGIVNVNQEAGNLNNQANVRVVAVGGADSAVQGLDLAGSARSLNNTVISSGGERENRISNSFGRTVGIVGANQSAGNLNQQANVLVLGLGAALGPEMVVLGDATLGEISARNTVKQEGTAGPRAEILTDSFGGFRGIAQVNQSAGDLNVMGNFFGLSVTAVTLP